jgi:hypothetical protein
MTPMPRLAPVLLVALGMLHSTPASAQGLLFQSHPIESNFPGTACVRLADMDGDGDLDIVVGSEWTPYSASQGLAYLRNDGGSPPQWTRFPLDASFANVMSVDIARVDADTLPDVVASSWDLHQIAWWQHSGDPTSAWTKRIIRSSFTNAHDAACADLDGDGDMDVAAVNSAPGCLTVCYNNGATPPAWGASTLTCSFSGAKSVVVNDLDEDDDPDILATAADANALAWWVNLGGSPPTWEKRTISSSFPGSHDLDVVDLDLDGMKDVIGAAWSSNQVAYWLCDDSLRTSWTDHVVSTGLPMAVRVLGSDFDRDGDVDIVAIGKIPGTLIVYENRDFSWAETVLATGFQGGWALEVDDLDQDGDPDIIAGASVLGYLYWWENQSTPPLGVPPHLTTTEGLRLEQNTPNPFTHRTVIRYALPATGYARLTVHDVAGRLVRVLADGAREAGWHSVELDATGLESGIYFCRLTSGHRTTTRRMLLLRGRHRS